MLTSLTRGLVVAQIAETLADYPSSDEPLQEPREGVQAQAHGFRDDFLDDGKFWQLFDNRTADREWSILEAALSEWVARVPDLFWSDASKEMRKVHPALIEDQTHALS